MASGVKRRRSRGSAWYWQQTDSWYYTQLGTKNRVPLLDETGKRIRGQDKKKEAELALARVKVARQWRPTPEPVIKDEWLVAKVCSEYIQDCQRRAANGSVTREYCSEVIRYLNDFCEYCGALPVPQLKKGYVQHWIESHQTWRSPATRSNAIAIIQAAFNHMQEEHDVRNPIKGLKKPSPQPRLHSFDKEDEAAIYEATDEPFANFLFAAVHTGLRPFCELAKLTAADVEESSRGMMWRVYSSKTKKTRKIPVCREVAELTRKLIGGRSEGSIVVFRNPQGNPWKKVTGVHRFLKIKRNLGWVAVHFHAGC